MNNVFNELEYLSNPNLFEKYKQQSKNKNNDEFKNDKKFYRKRIIQLTKDIYSNELDKYTAPLDEVKEKFNSYLVECIKILKIIDKNDCLQEEYKDLNFEKEKKSDISFNQIDTDSVLFNKPSINKIEHCMPIIKKKTHTQKLKVPIKKDLNLKAPELKIKGVKKKES